MKVESMEDKRKTDPRPRLLWIEGSRAATVRRFPERRYAEDTDVALSLLRSMFDQGRIKGFAGIALDERGQIILIASDEALEDAMRTQGALYRLIEVLSHFPEHSTEPLGLSPRRPPAPVG